MSSIHLPQHSGMAPAHDATVSFNACLDGTVDPRAGLPLSELLACPSSGRFFAPWEAQIRTELRSNPSTDARTFFCPVCPSAALRIHALGAQEAASCSLCGWVASRALIRAATDLLAREADPWPEVSATVVARATDATCNTHAHGINVLRAPPSRRTVAECLEKEKTWESSMRGLRVPNVTPVVQEDADAERRQGDLHVSKILPLSINVLAKDVWLRESLPPSRRLSLSRTVVASPHSGQDVHDAVFPLHDTNEKSLINAARFMPSFIYARVWHDCSCDDDSKQKVKVALAVRNNSAATVHIVITDFKAAKDISTVDAAHARIAHGDQAVLEMRAATQRVPHGPTKSCPEVVVLRMRASFDTTDTEVDCTYRDKDEDVNPFWKHEWHCTGFLTHVRSVLREG